MPSFEVTLPLTLVLLPLLLLLSIARARKPGTGLPPGPRPLPIIGNLHMLGRLPHRALANLAQKYGPIMSLRLGYVPTVVASSAEAAEVFLKQYDAVFASRPILQVWDHMVYGAKDVAFCPYGDYWRHVRKLMVSHLLSSAKVAGFEGLRRADLGAAMQRLKEAVEAREVVDVGERVGELIEEMLFKMVIGKGKGKGKYNDFRGALEEALALVGAFNLADFIPWLAPLDLQGLMHRVKSARKVTDEIFDDIIEDHLKEEDFGKNRDIIGLLLSLIQYPTHELSSPFGRDNVKALMFDMFAAGVDTMIVAITWALSALLKHPRVMKHVQAEVDAVVGWDQMVKESDLSKLNYLDMVIKETLRLFPPGPLLVAHESIEDTIVNGFMIPKKSRIIINMWAIGRDPNMWSGNVEEFYPERFMDKDQGQHFQLIPFGAGRRICPGMQLALTTTKLVIAHLVHCFDWELPNGMRPEDIDMAEKFGLTMPRANKLLATPYYRL